MVFWFFNRFLSPQTALKMTLEDSSEIELKLALKEALKANGSLNELQGQIRAQIYSCLNHNVSLLSTMVAPIDAHYM